MPTSTRSNSPTIQAGCHQIADDILRAIRRILRRTAEHSRHLASSGNLSVPQLLCLRSISVAPKTDPATVAGIAAQVQLSAATVSRILDRLEKEGLVNRQRSPADRRKVFVFLTTSGKRQVKKMPVPLQEEFLTRLMELDSEDQLRLLTSLEQIVDMMGAAELDAAPMLTPESNVKPRSI